MSHEPATRIGAEHVDYAAEQQFDLVVVGGGITGAWATAMAAAAGLKVCLIEAGDFGGATSRVSHRILHGGFRYLQTGDLSRLRESVRERREWFRCFPDLVEPLPCLMPLYGQGMKRPSAFRAAVVAYRMLALDRNQRVRKDLRLLAGGVLSSERTAAIFPGVRPDGLRGGGVWYDGVMRSHPRLIMSLLRFAARRGAVCLNHTAAFGISWERDGRECGGGTDGVCVRSGTKELLLRASRVLNATSTDADRWTEKIDGNLSGRLHRAMAFNLVLDLPSVSEHGVAVQPPHVDESGERRVYFLVPRHGRIAAGTMHVPIEPESKEPRVTWAMIDRMLTDLNAAVPGLGGGGRATREHVVRVDAGLLPADAAGSGEASDRPIAMDHGWGLVSAVSVKYTTARHTAAAGLRMLGCLPPVEVAVSSEAELPLELLVDPRPNLDAILSRREDLIALCRSEGVGSMADLLLGRTEWGEDPAHALALADHLFPVLADALGWSDETVSRERGTLAHALRGALPTEGETDPLSPG